MLELYAINIEECISPEKYEEWLYVVTDEQRTRIKQFRFLADAKRTLYGEILIRYLACKKLHIQNRDIEIERNAYGKPSLRNYHNFHYNISHSGSWVISAISDQTIGVDIEQVKPIDLGIAKRYFSKSEYESIMSESKDNRQNLFYQFWTAKESYVKYICKGLSITLNSFSVFGWKSRYCTIDIDTNCLIQTLKLGDYVISICHSILEFRQMSIIRHVQLEEVKL